MQIAKMLTYHSIIGMSSVTGQCEFGSGGGRGLTYGQNERVVTKQLSESVKCPFATS